MTATTTAPTNPAETAAEDIWRPKLIAETDGLPDGILPKLIDGGIERWGELDTETLHGDAPDRLNKLKLDGEQVAALMDLLDQVKRDALDEMSKPAEQPMPEPSRGEKGYQFKLPAKLGRYGSSGLSCSIRATIGVAGEDGSVGLRAGSIHRNFCGAQLDVEVREGDQASLDGPAPFYAVAKTAGVSFSADRTEAGFTMTFVHKAVDHAALERFAKGDVMLCINPIDADGDSDDDDSDD